MTRPLIVQMNCCSCNAQLEVPHQIVSLGNIVPAAIQPGVDYCQQCEAFACVGCVREGLCLSCSHESMVA